MGDDDVIELQVWALWMVLAARGAWKGVLLAGARDTL
jgi:hypothetical protein